MNKEIENFTERELGAIIKYYMNCNNLQVFSLMARLNDEDEIQLNAIGGVKGNEVEIYE